MSEMNWEKTHLSGCIASINGGVSVNSEDRPRSAGEIGVLKTSAVSAGRFLSTENKVVVARERARVAEPLCSDSILFSRMNTPALVGESCYVKDGDSTLFLPDRLWQIRVELNNTDARWLSCVLQTPQISDAIRALATGTSGSMKNISKKRLLALEISLPPLSEQHRIVDIIDALDYRICQAERAIAKLKLLGAGLMQKLLAGSAERGAVSRRAIGDICDTYSGGTPARSVPGMYGGNIPWIKSGEVNQRSIFETDETITEKALKLSSTKWVEAGTPLVAMYGATAGAVSWTDIRATTNQAVLALSATGKDLSARWLYWAMLYQAPKIVATVQGSGQPNLSKSILDNFRLPIPEDRREQLRSADILDAFDQQLMSEENACRALKLIRPGLLTDLVIGRVRVPAGVAS